MSKEIKIGVTGIASAEVVEALRRAGGIEPIAAVDIDAASRLVAGELSYLVGICESGGGAALAMAIAIAGADSCVNLSKLGRPTPAAELPALLDEGRVAFGMARDHVGALVPSLAAAILAR